MEGGLGQKYTDMCLLAVLLHDVELARFVHDTHNLLPLCDEDRIAARC
jgi:hypothetical protein